MSFIPQRELLLALDKGARHFLSNGANGLRATAGLKFGEMMDQRQVGLGRRHLAKQPDTGNPAHYAPAEAIPILQRVASGQSSLNSAKPGPLHFKSEARRIAKLAAAHLRLGIANKLRAPRSYRRWAVLNHALGVVASAEKEMLDVIDEGERPPTSRSRRRYQIVSTTRKSFTMPAGFKLGLFKFGGRAALRLPPGRPPLPRNEWIRRYKARGGRGQPEPPPTRRGRPYSPIPFAPGL